LDPINNDGSYITFENDFIVRDKTEAIVWRTNVNGAMILFGLDGSIFVADSARKTLWPTASDTTRIVTVDGITYVVDGSTVIWDSNNGLSNSGTQINIKSGPLTFTAPDNSTLVYGDDLVITDASENVFWNAGITGANSFSWNNDGSFEVFDASGNKIYPTGAVKYLMAIRTATTSQTVLTDGTNIFWGQNTGIAP
jgi:hypothetical protein